jgi:hypothetical protein
VARSAQVAGFMARVTRRFFVGEPMPDLQVPALRGAEQVA